MMVREQTRISAQQARNLHLAAQGLLGPPRARASRARVLAAIERMRLLQIDTINVVARSPYLVLFSRLGTYDPRWLDELLARGAIFECWAHEACFAPMADFALHRHPSPIRNGHWAHKHATNLMRTHHAQIAALLERIREHGAVRSSDFQRAITGAGGWWNRSLEKRLLEAAFVHGELMIARRENFQRIYDLAGRVMTRAGIQPASSRLDATAIRRQLLLDSVRALGVTQARWIADYFRLPGRLGDADLAEFVESGDLLPVAVRGWTGTGYVHRDNAVLLARAQRAVLRATHTALLSPFDPVVWDRARASAMFGFDYRIECYLPAPKRRYGYFVLPILHRGKLIGRLDAKAHRDDGLFEIKSIHLEAGLAAGDIAVAELAAAIHACAQWHATPRVIVRKPDPIGLAGFLRVTPG